MWMNHVEEKEYTHLNNLICVRGCEIKRACIDVRGGKRGQMAVIDKLILLDLTDADISHPCSSVSIPDWSFLRLLEDSTATEAPVGWRSWKCQSWQTDSVRYLRKTKWGNLTCSIIHLSFSIFTSQLYHKIISKIRFHNSMIALVTGFEDSFLNVTWPKFSENHDFDLNLSHHKNQHFVLWIQTFTLFFLQLILKL